MRVFTLLAVPYGRIATLAVRAAAGGGTAEERRRCSARRPVSRVLYPALIGLHPAEAGLLPYDGPGDDHLSSPDVAIGIERPTRGRAGCPYPPIRPCSGWGLPGSRYYYRDGELLPRHFTLIPIRPDKSGLFGTVYFLWHYPSGCPAPPLAGILPGGARTFLPPRRPDARQRRTPKRADGDGGRPAASR